MDERFAFVAEWFDNNAQLVREYQLFFYPTDNSVEMVRAAVVHGMPYSPNAQTTRKQERGLTLGLWVV